MDKKERERLEVKRRIDACFETAIDRDCENCLAHGDYGGPCCYGRKFDEYDKECEECPHHDDCAEDCGYELYEEEDDTVRVDPKGNPLRSQTLGPPIRTSIWDRLRDARTSSPAPSVVPPSKFTIQPRTRTGAISPSAPRASATPRTQTLAISREEYKYIPMDDRIPIGDEDPNETTAKRFVKDTVWGGGEGFFRAGYEFFRTRRLR